jgi:cell surface protein SprA
MFDAMTAPHIFRFVLTLLCHLRHTYTKHFAHSWSLVASAICVVIVSVAELSAALSAAHTVQAAVAATQALEPPLWEWWVLSVWLNAPEAAVQVPPLFSGLYQLQAQQYQQQLLSARPQNSSTQDSSLQNANDARVQNATSQASRNRALSEAFWKSVNDSLAAKYRRSLDSLAEVEAERAAALPALTPEDSTERAQAREKAIALNALTNPPLVNTNELREVLKIDSLGMRLAPAGAKVNAPNAMNRFWSPGYTFTAAYDSSRSTLSSSLRPNAATQVQFRSEESLYGVPQSTPNEYSLDEFVAQRRAYLNRKIQDSTFRHYEIKRQTKLELSNLLSQVSSLAIPIPQNPLSNLFGKPEIRLNIGIEYNIRMGWRWDAQNLGVASALGQVVSSPIFQQTITPNIALSLGDKFNLNLDYNPFRQFEFDNLANVSFNGDADDVFKRIELGNVTFATPSTYISSSQALFGGKLDFQLGPVFVKTIFATRRGQSKRVGIKGGSIKQPFALRAYDYAENHFFLDTVYKTVWNARYRASTPVIPAGFNQVVVKEVEVWESTNDLRDVLVSEAIAYADLPGRYLLADSSNAAALNVPRNQLRYEQSIFQDSTIRIGEVERGRFRRLEPSRYTVDQGNLGRIIINQLRRDRTYAVAYRIEGATARQEDDLCFGTLSNINTTGLRPGESTTSTQATVVLKLVYRPNMQPGFRSLWARQMQNVYNIGATNVGLKDSRIGFWYLQNNNDSVGVLTGFAQPNDGQIPTVLGIDRVNNANGQAPPDGVFDIGIGEAAGSIFFDPTRGEIVFPSLRPFNEGLKEYFVSKGRTLEEAAQFTYPDVYDTTREVARLNAQKDRFIISGEVSGRSSDRITLPNAFNLSPGSVKITLNGAPLQENVDYRVDYFSSQVQLLNPQATLPNANIDIEYEQSDVFTLQNRSLMGLRVDLDTKTLFKSRTVQSSLGFTAMAFEQALLVDRVRLGEESVRNVMVGVDGGFNWNADWLTRALDALPFFDTKTASSISLKGEIAAKLPDPNKRRSEIPSDGGQSVVYLDDFEGAQRPIPLSTQPGQWIYASPTLMDTEISPKQSALEFGRDAALLRGGIYWNRFTIPQVSAQAVYPNRCTSPQQRNLPDMFINFTPNVRGVYNPNTDYQDSLTYLVDTTKGASEAQRRARYRADSTAGMLFAQRERSKIWGGMMRLLSSFNTNFDNDNVEFLEIVMNVGEKEPGTRMYVDVGQISEDIIPDNQLNTEDGITETNPTPNGIIAQGEETEDVGIDMMNDRQERGLDEVPARLRQRGAVPYRFPLNLEQDPSRDNFAVNNLAASVNELDFVRANALEGNGNFEGTKFPDTEVRNLNNGQTLMTANDFFRYEINIQNTNQLTNPQIANTTPGGWVTYRIPLRGARQQFGNPLFSNVQYVRVWWKGGSFRGQVVDWQFVGSQWQRFNALRTDPQNPAVRTIDTTLVLSYVGLENNQGSPDFYTLPPGVTRPQQVNNPDPTAATCLNEQSLSMQVKNLRSGEDRQAIRFFRPFDIFYYKQLKFFLHGDGRAPEFADDIRTAPIIAFVRFGVDSNNYYEYRVPLRRGWQEVGVSLTDLTALKQALDSLVRFEGAVKVRPDGTRGEFATLGTPTLTRIQFIAFGIRNARVPGDLSTTMWANELRLIEPERSVDVAAGATGSIKLADLGTVTGTFSYTGPNFSRIEERFGDRISRLNWNVTAQFSLEKFLPREWNGTVLPVSYTHTEQFESPLFTPQNDVNVERFVESERVRLTTPTTPSSEAQRLLDSIRRRSETRVIEDQIAITGAKLAIPIEFFLFKDLINRVTTSFSYSQRLESSPVVTERFRWGWRFSTAYTNTFTPPPVRPFGWAENIPILRWLSEYTIYPLPNALSASVELDRNRQTELTRFLPVPSPPVRNFSASRQVKFSWRLSENELLNPTLDYSLQTISTLMPFELDGGRQRTGSEIFQSMLSSGGRVFNLGDDVQHNQNVAIAFRPKLPEFLGGKFLNMTGSFQTAYTWQNQFFGTGAQQDLGKSVAFANNIRFSGDFKLRELGNAIFGTGSNAPQPVTPLDPFNPNPPPPASTTPPETDPLKAFLGAIKSIFFDFDRVNFTLNQQNNATNAGVLGGSGIDNMVRAPLFGAFGVVDESGLGPSAAYQLGLVTDPFDRFAVNWTNTFPFVNFRTIAGQRPANSLLPDLFKQATTFEITVQRQLWEGASLALNWRTQFDFNRNRNSGIGADGFRVDTASTVLAVQSYNRTFLSLPIFPFDNTIERVVNTFTPRLAEIERQFPDSTNVQRNQQILSALNQSFLQGLEAFPWLAQLMPAAALVLPRVNWAFQWNGLERLPLLNNAVKRLSLEHKYTSNYQATDRVTDFGRLRESESVEVRFEPLVGLNAQFDDRVVNGALNGTVRYNTRTSFRIASAGRASISRETSNEFSAQASYTRRRVQLMLFDRNYESDLEIALQASYRASLSSVIDVFDYRSETGRRLDGKTSIVFEPSARYTFSQLVTARFFFRYEANLTEGAATPGSSTTQFGLDIRLNISGGR